MLYVVHLVLAVSTTFYFCKGGISFGAGGAKPPLLFVIGFTQYINIHLSTHTTHTKTITVRELFWSSVIYSFVIAALTVFPLHIYIYIYIYIPHFPE